MIIRSIIAALIACSCVTGAIAHEFKDGFVERTMAVVVRDQTAIVEYSVGMNAETMRQVVDRWAKNNKTTPSENRVDPVPPSQTVTKKATPDSPETAPLEKPVAPVLSDQKQFAAIQDNPIRPQVATEDG